MSAVELSDQQWGQLMNILGTTKEHAWVVTNPLLMAIGDQLRAQHQSQQQAPMPQGVRVDANGKEIRNE